VVTNVMGGRSVSRGEWGESSLGVMVDPSCYHIPQSSLTVPYTRQGRLHLGSDDRSRLR